MTDDDLLTPDPCIPNDGFRADLLAQTTGRLRIARRLRLTGRLAVCLACFAAGAATVYLHPERQTLDIVAITAPAVEPPASPPRTVFPAELELMAEQAVERAEAARRFREAGDLYLRDFADYRAALRCYRNFLDGADPADRAASPNDTWLLTSLKRAREQENTQ